ncbi:hypothetical protein [Alkalihalobacillus sp. TS-13]|uniref:hypothetical protein n=1 Tax=Alkalihalobacillus sp. TS-13 TaxID=2842455 RepID=UPI001C88D1E1|nr:hypothetical protein [Alkalihalobacillus sp. TS-13]
MMKHLSRFREDSSLNQIHFPKEKMENVYQRVKPISNKTFIFKKTLSFATLSILLLIIGSFGYHSLQSEKADQSEKTDLTKPLEEEENDPIEFNEDDAENLTKKFIDMLIQEIDEPGNNVIKYHSKSALVKELEPYASNEVAEKWVDSFYEERDGELHMYRLHGIPTIDFGKEYDITKEDERFYTLSQEKHNELNGTHIVNIHFKYTDREWLISKYDIEYVEE